MKIDCKDRINIYNIIKLGKTKLYRFKIELIERFKEET